MAVPPERHEIDYQYDFGIWQSTKRIREAMEGRDVPDEVRRLLNHIDGLAAEYTDKLRMTHGAPPGSKREARILRMMKSMDVYRTA